MENLRLIAASLMTIDIWAIITFEQSYKFSPKLLSRELFVKLSQDIFESVCCLRDYANSFEARFEIVVQDRLKTFSDAAIIKLLSDLSTSNYYAKFIQLRTVLYSIAVTEYKYSSSASNLMIKENSYQMKTPQQYLKYLTIQVNENKVKLRTVVDRIRTLRRQIKLAAERNELTPTILGALKEKMIALQLNFHDACIEADYAILPLIDQSKAEWW